MDRRFRRIAAGLANGYTTDQIHLECLRQIREYTGGVIDNANELRDWLAAHRMR
jgi:hypothetical protein